jgi:hypothetical protein
MNVDQGTLGLSAMTFSTPFIVTHAYICFSVDSIAPHDTTSMPQNAPLPLLRVQSFGAQFDARLFSARERSTSELLRTL